ncbi:MAG TPA: Zn-dependent hydrolase [Anaerolineae bacterium]|nr:Zn-dependent hydrolase [Anaerolineae bacterium]
MTSTYSSLRINSDRMLDSFTQVSVFGSTSEGGVNRPSFSEAHLQARKWFRDQIESSGFEFRTDGAGNHSAVIASEKKQSPTLIIGSHLDSVPNGGKYDGGLGVAAAFEVLKIIQENRIKLKVNVEAMDFTDEEGTLVGLLGSAAISGHLHQKDLDNPRGGRENLIEGMKRAGLSDESMLSAKRDPKTLAGYLELHIEQGKRLEKSKINIGIVSAIVGIASYRLTFIGKANHAGTTTMEDRLDASLGASSFTLKARELVMNEFKNSVVNVGKMEFAPGAFNIVPAQVDLSLEFRSATQSEFDKLDEALISLTKSEAKQFGLELKIEFLGKHSPSPMSDKTQTAFASACDDLGLTHTSLTSGAGHDAQSLADLCPVGMIFVPSVNGISHSPREFTEWEDCVNGANVLLHAVLKLGID